MIIDKEEFFQEKVTSAYEERLFKDYQRHGKQAFDTLRKEEPEMFIRIAAWLLGHDVVLDALRKLDKLDALKKGGAKDGNSEGR